MLMMITVTTMLVDEDVDSAPVPSVELPQAVVVGVKDRDSFIFSN